MRLYEQFRRLQQGPQPGGGRQGQLLPDARRPDFRGRRKHEIPNVAPQQRVHAVYGGDQHAESAAPLRAHRQRIQGRVELLRTLGRQCHRDVQARGEGGEYQCAGHRPDHEGALPFEHDRPVRRHALQGGVQGNRGEYHAAEIRRSESHLRLAADGPRKGQHALHEDLHDRRQARPALQRRRDQMAEVHQLALSASADAREQPQGHEFGGTHQDRIREPLAVPHIREQRRQRHAEIQRHASVRQ